MTSLVRRIKDLDPNTFQQLCFNVMSERFPNAKVRYPEGAAGDEGIDLFEGDLIQGPTVWQCKAFAVTVLGDSQKRQIKESLRHAVRSVQPKLWILCLNLDLDTKAARGFSDCSNLMQAKAWRWVIPLGQWNWLGSCCSVSV